MFEIVSVRIHPGKQNGIKSRELVTQMKKTWETYRLVAWETTLSLKLKKHLGEAELPGLRSWGHLPKAANTGPTQKKLEPWRWSRCGRLQRATQGNRRERGWFFPSSFPQEPGLWSLKKTLPPPLPGTEEGRRWSWMNLMACVKTQLLGTR